MRKLNGSDRMRTCARTSVLLVLACLLFVSLAPRAWASVTLIKFEAVPQHDGTISVRWETATELSSVAFRLYRAQAAAGPWTQVINQQPARGDVATGATYEYGDTDVVAGVRYYYLLEELTQNGPNDQFGPVNALAAPPIQWLKVYLPLVLRAQ